ncbi:pituitary tumor-transforming gene 1 protein-interacting protein-like [Platichthys flesus]|uniref:pituitary tumor-transforming gene 1 protein-interacting protein-like n=1 Tax=Platichthys flesus TaxID=8260 RepID=UPI002DBB9019|nr:pituitary tumor-transforming gene 1 protein-interacting protein-like [Platichthys flesus]
MALVSRALVAAAVLTLFSLLLSVAAQTLPPAPIPCATKSNTSCIECLKDVNCLWCGQNKQCIDYPVRSILPPSSICPLDWARWGVCWLNLKGLLIGLSAVAGSILIITIFLCCCCCCRCPPTFGSKKEAARMEGDTQMGNAGRNPNCDRKKQWFSSSQPDFNDVPKLF